MTNFRFRRTPRHQAASVPVIEASDDGWIVTCPRTGQRLSVASWQGALELGFFVERMGMTNALKIIGGKVQ